MRGAILSLSARQHLSQKPMAQSVVNGICAVTLSLFVNRNRHFGGAIILRRHAGRSAASVAAHRNVAGLNLLRSEACAAKSVRKSRIRRINQA